MPHLIAPSCGVETAGVHAEPSLVENQKKVSAFRFAVNGHRRVYWQHTYLRADRVDQLDTLAVSDVFAKQSLFLTRLVRPAVGIGGATGGVALAAGGANLFVVVVLLGHGIPS